MSLHRDRAARLLATLAAASVAVLVFASPGPAATPRPKGVYTGTLVNEDQVQMNVAADGKSATFTVGCQDLGETYPFPRFPIVNGTFSATIWVPGSKLIPQAKLHGTFTSATQASIVLNEHPDRSKASRYLCFGITSPATLTLKGA
jgi:hypothetical protein